MSQQPRTERERETERENPIDSSIRDAAVSVSARALSNECSRRRFFWRRNTVVGLNHRLCVDDACMHSKSAVIDKYYSGLEDMFMYLNCRKTSAVCLLFIAPFSYCTHMYIHTMSYIQSYNQQSTHGNLLESLCELPSNAFVKHNIFDNQQREFTFPL